jgi:hypothetical protein
MTKQVHTKKAELENEVTETQAAQIQLDKTAEDFRALHNERQVRTIKAHRVIQCCATHVTHSFIELHGIL